MARRASDQDARARAIPGSPSCGAPGQTGDPAAVPGTRTPPWRCVGPAAGVELSEALPSAGLRPAAAVVVLPIAQAIPAELSRRQANCPSAQASGGNAENAPTRRPALEAAKPRITSALSRCCVRHLRATLGTLQLGASRSLAFGPALWSMRLTEHIRRVHRANFQCYGYHRVHGAPLRAGETAGRDQVARLMPADGLRGAKRRGKP